MGTTRRRLVTVIGTVIGIMLIAGLAYAGHTFNDVPDDHLFHSAIAWMQENGITKGCNPPANSKFCPDDYVSRGQMAAFMARAAKSRSFDAGTLDGIDSSAFAMKGDPAGDADTLDGLDSTDFVQDGQKVSDSDTLDGKDSIEFLSSDVSVREVTEAVTIGAVDVTSDCQVGEQILGGGFASSGGLSVNATGSFPAGTGWEVTGTVTLGGSITVYAICAATG